MVSADHLCQLGHQSKQTNCGRALFPALYSCEYNTLIAEWSSGIILIKIKWTGLCTYRLQNLFVTQLKLIFQSILPTYGGILVVVGFTSVFFVLWHFYIYLTQKLVSGELSSAVLLYAHIRLPRNYFLLPHESWIYLCNSIPKKKAELGWSNKSYWEAVFM